MNAILYLLLYVVAFGVAWAILAINKPEVLSDPEFDAYEDEFVPVEESIDMKEVA